MTTSIKSLIVSLFGSYSPLTNSDGEYITTIAGLDFEWIFAVIIFCICLYCVLRMLGGLISEL